MCVSAVLSVADLERRDVNLDLIKVRFVGVWHGLDARQLGWGARVPAAPRRTAARRAPSSNLPPPPPWPPPCPPPQLDGKVGGRLEDTALVNGIVLDRT